MVDWSLDFHPNILFFGKSTSVMINSRERQTNDVEEGILDKSVRKSREKRFETTQSRFINLMKVLSLCDLISWSRF
jgi:hypothetical protein